LTSLFANVAAIECADKQVLEDALAAGLTPYVVWRISDTAVVVDHERIDEILKLLRRQGATPKVTQE